MGEQIDVIIEYQGKNGLAVYQKEIAMMTVSLETYKHLTGELVRLKIENGLELECSIGRKFSRIVKTLAQLQGFEGVDNWHVGASKYCFY